MYGPCRQKDPVLRSDLQHSMGLDATCREMTRPLGSGTCTRNTRRTRVFFLPMSVSPFRSSMSAFRSFRMPAQSMLHRGEAGSLSRKVHPQTLPRWSTDCLLPTATAGNCISPGLVITRTLCQEVGFFKKKKKITEHSENLLSGDCFSREIFLINASIHKSTGKTQVGSW